MTVFTLSQAVLALSYKKTFSDVEIDHHYAASILWMKNNGVVEGYADGTFKPEKSVSRAEFLKMLYKVKGLSGIEGNMKFPDVSSGDWFYPYVKEAYLSGVVKGYDDGKFHPDKMITFAEAVKIVSNAFFDVDSWFESAPYEACFEDLSYMANDPGAWYWKFFYVAEGFCIVPVETYSGEYGFGASIAVTRGDMAEMLYRAKAVVDSGEDSPALQKYDGKIVPKPIDQDADPVDAANVFDPMTIKVGDKVGAWTVKNVGAALEFDDMGPENFQIEFFGEVEVSGEYSWSEFGGDFWFDELTSASKAKIPEPKGDQIDTWFMFLNDAVSIEAFGPSRYNAGKATIVITDYTVARAPAEIGDSAVLKELVSKDNSKLAAVCTDEPEVLENGRTVHPVDEMYYPAELGWLGQLFTANACGEDRVKELFAVDGDDYTVGSAVWLDEAPSAELMDVFSDLGFVCAEDLGLESCDHWTLSEVVEWKDMLKLEPYSWEMSKDDCVLCG
ncbi:S-layer homology domain-containing protein [Candidatus Peregrinibacteria bacterium]|nr:S-layer homology domain-containing protein [Candidatus Peregrinibacteria bacterium]